MILGYKDNFHFRLITASDEEKVRKIIFEILEDYGLVIDIEGVDADLYNTTEYYKDHLFAVVESEENEVVGSFGLFALDAKKIELRKMYIQNSARGFGLGKWMVNFSIAYAKRCGYEFLSLETASVLVEAEQLYQSMGFERRQEVNATTRCNRIYEMKLI